MISQMKEMGEAVAEGRRGGSSTHTVRAAPLALRSPVKLRIKADEVVGTRAGVTQNDLPTLLAHLTVVLVVRLIAIAIIDWEGGRGSHGGLCPHSPCTTNLHCRLSWHILGTQQMDEWMAMDRQGEQND